MKLIFRKCEVGSDNGSFTCIRDDGSTTWQKSTEYFVRHDLIHFSVETTMGYRQAFLGLLSSGRDIQDFGTKNGIRDEYTQEAAFAESIVGLLQWPSVTGGVDLNDAEFFDQLKKMFFDVGAEPPAVSPCELGKMRDTMHRLHAEWADIEPGGTLELAFPSTETL